MTLLFDLQIAKGILCICNFRLALVSSQCHMDWGLLDRSTARYFYKQPKASLHKPTGLLENLFPKKGVFKNNLQHLEKMFFSQTNTTPKMAFYLTQWPIC
jgi:hypothetical protein